VARVRIESVEKRFGAERAPVVALAGLSLDVADGECVAILGPSGCGKTTLLRLVAGLEHPDKGRISIGERDVAGEPPERRGVGMVFQSDAIFPHLSTLANISYGLHGRGLSAAAIAARARDVARRMRVEDLLSRPARDLSGGQRQRVAVARALAPEPSVLLLDEPFSRLDAPLRAGLRVELGRILRDAPTTTLFVTHDQSEAMALAARIAVLRDGSLEQYASPRELYDAPATEYVAGFVGSPAMSFVPARAVSFGRDFPGAATLGFRPDAVRPAANGEVAGLVRAVEDFGADAYAYVDTEAGTLVARVTDRSPLPGERVTLEFDRARAHPFDAAGLRLGAFARV
jgi:multiple sugar transport system ATP-binding protein